MPIIQTKRGKIYTFTPEADGEVELTNPWDVNDPVLPVGYTRLAYLESTGTQCIRPYLAVQGLSIYTKFKPMLGGAAYALYQATAAEGIFAKASSTNTIDENHLHYDTAITTSEGQVGCVMYNKPVGSITEGEVNVQDKYVLLKVGETVLKKPINISVEFTYPNAEIALFCQNTVYREAIWGEQAQFRAIKTQLFEFRAWYEKDSLARNFIPAVDAVGKPCLYDLVTKQPFYNFKTSTTDFIAGIDTLKQLYYLLVNLPDLTGQADPGELTIRLAENLQTDELRALIDARGEAKNWEISEAV